MKLSKYLPSWLDMRAIFPTNSKELDALLTGPTNTAGIRVTEETALNYSAFWAAVNLISGDVASLPLVLYKRQEDSQQPYISHPLFRILHDEPNPEMSSYTFREVLEAHVLTWGNGYAEIQRNIRGDVVALWPITPDRVEPFRQDGRLKYRVSNSGSPDSILEARQILHIHGLGFDGIQGYSVVSMAQQSLGLGLATEQFGGAFFGNGSTFGGILSHPGQLSPQAKENLRKSLEAKHKGVERAHKLMVLSEGMTYTPFGIPPNDAQFLETRKFQVSEIARWFGVPPHMIGDLERATFTNIEHQTIHYFKSALRKRLVQWEQEINRKLVSPLERNRMFAEFNAEGFLRGDSNARADYYQKMFRVGALTINQIAKLENQNPIGPDGDVRYIARDLQPVDRINDIIDAQVQPKADPEPPQPEPEPDPEERSQLHDSQAAADLFKERLKVSHRGLMVDAVSRMLARECNRARRHAGNPEALTAWADQFYSKHVEDCETAFLPAVTAMLALRESSADPRAVARSLAKAHCERSKQDLAGLEEPADLESLLNQWQQDRPNMAGDRVLLDDISHE